MHFIIKIIIHPIDWYYFYLFNYQTVNHYHRQKTFSEHSAHNLILEVPYFRNAIDGLA